MLWYGDNMKNVYEKMNEKIEKCLNDLHKILLEANNEDSPKKVEIAEQILGISKNVYKSTPEEEQALYGFMFINNMKYEDLDCIADKAMWLYITSLYIAKYS